MTDVLQIYKQMDSSPKLTEQRRPHSVSDYVSMMEGAVAPVSKPSVPSTPSRPSRPSKTKKSSDALESISQILDEYGLSKSQRNRLLDSLQQQFIVTTATFLRNEGIQVSESYQTRELPLMESAGRRTEWRLRGDVLEEVIVG